MLIKIKEDSRFLKRALPVNIELYQHNKSPANLARLLQAYEPRETRKDIYDENRFFQRRNHDGGCIPYNILSRRYYY